MQNELNHNYISLLRERYISASKSQRTRVSLLSAHTFKKVRRAKEEDNFIKIMKFIKTYQPDLGYLLAKDHLVELAI